MSLADTLRKPSGFLSPRSFCGLVLVIIALQALAKAAAGMGLFADGSYFLLRVGASTDQPYYLFLFVLPGCYTGCSVDSFVVEAAIIAFLLAFLDDVLYCSS